MGEFLYHSDKEKHRISFSAGSDKKDDPPFLQGIVRGFPKRQTVPPDKSSFSVRSGEDSVNFGQLANLRVSKHPLSDNPEVECVSITLTSHSKDYSPEIEFDLEPQKVYWYGGCELFTQQWPMHDVCLPEGPYLSTDYLDRSRGGRVPGPVLERFWINSRGIGICVDNDVPLHISWDSTYGQFRLKAKFEGCQYANMLPSQEAMPALSLSIYKAANVKDVHQAMSKVCFKKPLGKPDGRMLRNPVWSTWASYKVNIDQTKVLEFARNILEHGFSNSQLEIDDMFTSFYGDVDFAKEKFSDPKAMIESLKKQGFRVSVWVMPFANIDSEAFKVGTRKGYFIKEARGEAPALVKWWQGIGGILDLTNPEAVDWYSERLRKFQLDNGVDSFKFDAGEIGFLPMNFKTFRPLKNPGEYTTLYSKLVGSFGGMVEMRAAFMSQETANFVRVMDKDSCWGHDNGLQSLIPSVLTIGILGYPYVLPDMIGGNAYGADGEILAILLPERELFIRWLEVTAYLPSMQFSVVPWQFDKETIQIAKKFVNIHENIVTPRIIEAVKEAQAQGVPLIRPIWWISPEDNEALQIDSEFLVGDSLLVAPVVQQGKRERNIYLPEGRWKDELRNTIVGGKIWLENYRIELDQVATFIKL